MNISPLMPDEDKNFGGSLVLDIRQWWRDVKTSYSERHGILKWNYLHSSLQIFRIKPSSNLVCYLDFFMFSNCVVNSVCWWNHSVQLKREITALVLFVSIIYLCRHRQHFYRNLKWFPMTKCCIFSAFRYRILFVMTFILVKLYFNFKVISTQNL